AASVTTGSPAMLTTTHPLLSLAGCTYLGTTSARTSKFAPPSPPMAAPLGPLLSTSTIPSSVMSRSPPTKLPGTCTSQAWMKTAAVAALPARPTETTRSTAPPTVVSLIPTPIPGRPSQALGVQIPGSSATCTPARLIGGTWAGVRLLLTTTSYTTTMPLTAAVMTLATFSTSVPPH